jgi:deoxyadenosine/deoxycytidine kinase
LSSDSLPFNYLAIDGPIGVGKTTLVDMLVRRFEGVKVLEDAENPFLDKFYKDRPGAAFQTQLYYLLSRFQQQQGIVQQELFRRLVVADYPFQKDRVFAYLNLSDDELLIYDKLYGMLEAQVPDPDLLLYLVELIDAYNHYYHHYRRTPLLVVDTRHLNFPQRPEDFEELVAQLKKPIKGTQYYVPLGSR